MRKLKVYIDTSVISHLFAEDTPDRMADTSQLWEEFRAGKYELCISTVTVEELRRCAEPKLSKMTAKLDEIDFEILRESDEARELADEYVKNGVLRQKSYDDCLHIAHAVVNNCDIIVSWNFKHFVNYKTISNVKIVNAINQYREISIITPTMLIEEV